MKVILIIVVLVLLVGCDELSTQPPMPDSQNAVEQPVAPEVPKEIKDDKPIVKPLNLSALDTKSENNTFIEEVSVRPVCRNGKNSGEIYYKVISVPKNVDFQVRTATVPYKTVLSKPGIYENYAYFSICDDCEDEDFQLKPDEIYVLRIMFNHTKPYVKMEQSNEYLINTSINSTYFEKTCQSKIKLTRW